MILEAGTTSIEADKTYIKTSRVVLINQHTPGKQSLALHVLMNRNTECSLHDIQVGSYSVGADLPRKYGDNPSFSFEHRIYSTDARESTIIC